MGDLSKLTIAEARDGMRAGSFSSVEITKDCLSEIEGAGALNAFVHNTPEIALSQAEAADARIKGGDAPAMCGVPLGIKDLFATKGVDTQAASDILKGFKPEYESTITQQLWDAGSVMLGKLNMDQFAMGSSNETSCYGDVVSPWKIDDRNLTPGGSSGGSASAVAADLCLAATGTDTGGSIRQPAAFVGITGLKPTYGRCSRWGVVAFASSLDQAGPMTKSVFGPEVQRRVMIGTYVLSAGFYDAYYNRARKVRTLIKRDFEEVFAQGVDAILTPATPSAAFGLGEMKDADPVQMYLNDVFTVTVNLAGLPGIAVPAGLNKQGLPLGLQLIGRPWEEADLLNHAYVLEQAAGFVAKPAKWW